MVWGYGPGGRGRVQHLSESTRNTPFKLRHFLEGLRGRMGYREDTPGVYYLPPQTLSFSQSFMFLLLINFKSWGLIFHFTPSRGCRKARWGAGSKVSADTLHSSTFFFQKQAARTAKARGRSYLGYKRAFNFELNGQFGAPPRYPPLQTTA